ncbi:MAG: glutamate-1-semialdehyde 2,1-aminomutase [Myxococcota bacterium]|nr:glutamate-1-semialdehyde 2,1-aminomutase [Myxococcota bacterium]
MNKSKILFERAKKRIPGGVNSPVRAFKAVKGDPPFIKEARGCWMIDEDGNKILDLIGSWGPMIIGHAHPSIIQAIQETAQKGTSFGTPTRGEVFFAEELCSAHPALDMVRLCSSGTEATMHAIRLARGFTQRDHIVKIDGCYHGAHDSMLVKAGSGVATFAAPGSPGIPADVAKLTLTAPFNNLEVIQEQLSKYDVAAVILEAVPGNMGCIIPKENYLSDLLSLCRSHGTLLIVDEVMTGFRLARGGACEYYNIKPDLVCLGKIVGGGLPLAAFGGREEVMSCLSPKGAVYQAGTLSGNPLAVAAGRATLELLTPEFYDRLNATSEKIDKKIRPLVEAKDLSMNRVGSMFTIFFRADAPTCFQEVLECDFEAFGRFHALALEERLYFPPSQYEAVFLSASIEDSDIEFFAAGIESALSQM